MSKLEEAWPLWPSDNKSPFSVLDVEVGCSADKLFELLWAPNSSFVVRTSCSAMCLLLVLSRQRTYSVSRVSRVKALACGALRGDCVHGCAACSSQCSAAPSCGTLCE